MMADIKIWEDKIKEKNKKTDFRIFVKTILSRLPLILQKNSGQISRYPQTPRIKNIINYKDYEASREELLSFGMDYDFNMDFFGNYQRLFQGLPFPNVINFGGTENADFCDAIMTSHNCYLGFTVITDCENVFYSFSVKDHSINIFNSNVVWDNNENVFMSNGIMKSFKIFYSRYIHNCSNIWFSSNLIGCQECMFCDDLENQSYCIRNKKYSQEDYFKEKDKLLRQKDRFMLRQSEVNNKGKDIGSQNTQGVFNLYSENIENGFYTYQVNNGRNLVLVGGAKGNENMYNIFTGGSVKSEDMYGGMGVGVNTSNIYCSSHIATGSTSIYYSYFLDACSYCIGCVGLKNKSFCILNKQYEKEERFELADKIFAQMEKDGILGTFFSGSMNPFYFNDTAAYLIDDSFTKEEVTKEGYLRRDEEIKVDVPTNAEVITTKDLVQYEGFNNKGEREIDKDILKKVIQDDKGNYYRIMPMELEFLQKHGLPLPEIHRLERIKLGFKFK